MTVERFFGVALLLSVAACDGGGASPADTEGTGGPADRGSSTAPPSGGEGEGSTEGTGSSGPVGSSTQGEDSGVADSGLPPGVGCCEAHEGPGCNEQGVALCVCAESPECCVFDWLETCAQRAQSECAATCESDDSGGTTETGSGGLACRETQLLQLGAEDAMVSGNWGLSMSQAGVGQIAVINPNAGTSGEVRWEIDVPCEDTWTILVRLFDQGEADSFFATLDGEPMPAAIFEGGIQGLGQGWNWRALNWRDPDDPAIFIEDPWAPLWGEGTHAVALSYRESIAVARIEVTNDPAYAP